MPTGFSLHVVDVKGVKGGYNQQGDNRNKPGEGGVARYTVSWSFAPVEETEVSVEPESGYDQWTPEGNLDDPSQPGKRLTVKCEVRKKGDPGTSRKALLEFSLPHVSEQKGVCINWPKAPASGKGLRFHEKDFPAGGKLKWVDATHVRTTELVDKVELPVACYDYGAWGTLRVTGNDGLRPVKVLVRGKDTPDLDIPLDDNGNRIADAWETDKGVKGYAANWDGAEVPGHKNKGDGLTLYEKYRGAVVLGAGGRTWTRLEPKEKVLFIVDKADLILADAWKKASGIRLYKLSEDMAKSRGGAEAAMLVNHCASDPRKGDKGAVVITQVEGAMAGEKGTIGITEGFPPMKNSYCRIFKKTHAQWISNILRDLRIACSDRSSEQWANFTDKCGLPLWLLERALQQLSDPANQQKLLQQQLRSTAIHELGHACSLLDHTVGGEATSTGNRMCFMCYTNVERDWQFAVLQILFKSGSLLPTESGIFCRDSDFNCFGKLDIKDN